MKTIVRPVLQVQSACGASCLCSFHLDTVNVSSLPRFSQRKNRLEAFVRWSRLECVHCCWAIIKMMEANCLFGCPSRSLPHAEHYCPSVDFPQGCFLFCVCVCHRFFAVLIFSPVDDSCNPIWCLVPAADLFHNSSKSLSLSLSVSLSLSLPSR